MDSSIIAAVGTTATQAAIQTGLGTLNSQLVTKTDPKTGAAYSAGYALGSNITTLVLGGGAAAWIARVTSDFNVEDLDLSNTEDLAARILPLASRMFFPAICLVMSPAASAFVGHQSGNLAARKATGKELPYFWDVLKMQALTHVEVAAASAVTAFLIAWVVMNGMQQG